MVQRSSWESVIVIAAFVWREEHPGPLKRITVADVTAGAIPSQRFYGEVTGHGDLRAGIKTQKGSTFPMYYFPLRATATENGVVHVVVEVQENDIDDRIRYNASDQSITARGMVDRWMPNEVVVWLKHDGLVLADGCAVIHTHADPERAAGFIPIAIAFFAAFAGFTFWRNRRARSKATSTPV